MPAQLFQRRLAERLLQAMGLGLVVGASVHACGSGSDDIGESGGGGAGGDGPSTTGAGACTPTSVVGGGVFTETVCLDVCPPAGQEDAAIAAQLEAECCADGSYGVCRSLTSVVCGPFAYWGPCCWETRQAAESCDPCLLAGPPCGPDNTCPGGQPCSPGSCCGTEGRPLRIEGEPVTARAVGDGSWPRKARPDVSQLSADDRRELASHWEKQALDEHASVASFARFALSLLSFGAPRQLVEEAQRAGLDEIAHARGAFGLASAYAGHAVGPGKLDLTGLTMPASLAELALETFVDGCVNETIAVVQAAERLAQARDPAVIDVLEKVVEDESRHAELAFRAVAWALAVGREPVRRALTEWLQDAAEPQAHPSAWPNARQVSHGRSNADAVAAQAWRQVVMPCARALLG